MNTGSFSCFISKSFNFYLQTPWIQVCFLTLSQKVSIFASIPVDVVFMCFVFTPNLLLRFLFLPLFAFVCVFFPVFCFLSTCSLFLLKLSFLSQKALIFISKLYEQRFVFLLYLKKLWFLPLSLLMWFWCASFFLPVFFCVFFFYLYLHLYAFFLFLFRCMFIVSSKAVILSQKALILISKLHEHKFVFLLSLSTLKFFCVPEPFPTLLSLGFLAFWVQICSIGYFCDRQQQRRQQIVSDMKRTRLWCISFLLLIPGFCRYKRLNFFVFFSLIWPWLSILLLLQDKSHRS